MSKSPTKKTKEEQAEYKRQWYLKNKERHIENAKKYVEENKENVKAKRKLYRENNKDKIRQKKKEYYDKNKIKINENRKRKYATNEDGTRDKRHKYVKDNPVIFRTYRSLRRAKEKSQLHPDHNKNIEIILRESANRIENCLNIKFCVDHILPIKHGGMHHHLNMQIMPSDINLKKNASLTWEHNYYKNWKQIPDYLIPENLKKMKCKLDIGDFDSLLDCANLVRTIDKRSNHAIGIDV